MTMAQRMNRRTSVRHSGVLNTGEWAGNHQTSSDTNLTSVLELALVILCLY